MVEEGAARRRLLAEREFTTPCVQINMLEPVVPSNVLGLWEARGSCARAPGIVLFVSWALGTDL